MTGTPICCTERTSRRVYVKPGIIAGDFNIRPQEGVTDIAIDRNGQMVGVSFYNLYSIDPRTAACTLLAPLVTGGEGTPGPVIWRLMAPQPDMIDGILNGTGWQPPALTANVTLPPAFTVWFCGCARMTGGKLLAVSTAMELVTLPMVFVTRTE